METNLLSDRQDQNVYKYVTRLHVIIVIIVDCLQFAVYFSANTNLSYHCIIDFLVIIVAVQRQIASMPLLDHSVPWSANAVSLFPPDADTDQIILAIHPRSSGWKTDGHMINWTMIIHNHIFWVIVETNGIEMLQAPLYVMLFQSLYVIWCHGVGAGSLWAMPLLKSCKIL